MRDRCIFIFSLELAITLRWSFRCISVVTTGGFFDYFAKLDPRNVDLQGLRTG